MDSGPYSMRFRTTMERLDTPTYCLRKQCATSDSFVDSVVVCVFSLIHPGELLLRTSHGLLTCQLVALYLFQSLCTFFNCPVLFSIALYLFHSLCIFFTRSISFSFALYLSQVFG